MIRESDKLNTLVCSDLAGDIYNRIFFWVVRKQSFNVDIGYESMMKALKKKRSISKPQIDGAISELLNAGVIYGFEEACHPRGFQIIRFFVCDCRETNKIKKKEFRQEKSKKKSEAKAKAKLESKRLVIHDSTEYRVTEYPYPSKMIIVEHVETGTMATIGGDFYSNDPLYDHELLSKLRGY